MKHRFLATRLDAAAARLTERVLREMYVDPFWHERFGERADTHGKKDGRFHIDYLIQALHADDPAIMENYARWLQPLLTSRGMSTRHLDENFARLAVAIRDEAWTDGDAAIALLDAARAALSYPPGPARELQHAATALAVAAASVAFERHPTGPAPWRDAGRATWLDELESVVAYAADALALAHPAVLEDHAVWLAGFLERRQHSRHHLIEALEQLVAAAPGIVPAAADELDRVVEPAIAAVRRGG